MDGIHHSSWSWPCSMSCHRQHHNAVVVVDDVETISVHRTDVFRGQPEWEVVAVVVVVVVVVVVSWRMILRRIYRTRPLSGR